MSGPAEPRCSAPLHCCATRIESVLELAWLAPGAASLAALARQPSLLTWKEIRLDPGAVLLIVRQSAGARTGRSSPPPRFSPTLLTSPSLPDDALRWLDQPTGYLSWDNPGFRALHEIGLAAAELASRQAEQAGCCDPEIAWICGLLAPLGWLALCAADPDGVTRAVAAATPGQPVSPPGEVDPGACARRLARRWSLPPWLAAVIGNLALPVSVAGSCGTSPVLLALTRQALLTVQKQRLDLGLASTLYQEEDRAILERVGVSQLPAASISAPALPGPWQDPREAPLLRDLLHLAAENRRLKAQATVQELEDDLDHLHRALREQLHSEAHRLQRSKLEALAELSGGAGHEINNPLAVISMQAQYLLSHQADWLTSGATEPAIKALQTIVAQTRRIHGILRGLMQFARPAPACPGWLDLPTLLGEVAASQLELATQRRVQVEVAAQPERLAVLADPDQLRTALACLLRNAIEAAPADGWARLRIVPSTETNIITVAVEDSGPGPEAAQRDHLFEPFYSGHVAGRGQGLGLSVAWRLARQQGGDVNLEPPQAGEPTRFLLTLPRREPPAAPMAPPADPVICARQAS